jgi:hypothetical protein
VRREEAAVELVESPPDKEILKGQISTSRGISRTNLSRRSSGPGWLSSMLKV